MKILLIFFVLLSEAFTWPNDPGSSTAETDDRDKLSQGDSYQSVVVNDDANNPFLTPNDLDTPTVMGNIPTTTKNNGGQPSGIQSDVPSTSSVNNNDNIEGKTTTKLYNPMGVKRTYAEALGLTENWPLTDKYSSDAISGIPTVSSHMDASTNRDTMTSTVIHQPSVSLLESKLQGIDYINRIYLPRQLDSTSLPSTDTSTAIALSIINGEERNIIAIVGEAGSGKTVALSNILEKLRMDPAGRWTTFIDANQAMPDQQPADWIELASQNLFGEVIDRGSTKVNILIDNIDKLPPYMIRGTTLFLRGLHKRGYSIVFTTSSNIEMIDALVKPENTFDIPQLNAREMESFLTQYWDKSMNPDNHREHMDYAKAVAAVVEKMPLFKNFATMTQLNKILATDQVGSTGGDVIPGFKMSMDLSNFISVEQYVKNGVSNPIMLVQMLKDIKFNKLGLTEYLMSPIVTDAYENHALPAMEHLLQTESIGSPLHEMLSFMRQEATNTKKPSNTLLQHCADYFTARYFIDHVRHGEQRLISAIEELMVRPEYANVMEYFNAAPLDSKSASIFEPVFKQIVDKGGELWHTIMDNAVSHGYDEIASSLFNAVDSIDKISAYFENDVTNADRTKLKSTTKYKMGVMTEATSRPIEANRQEMIFRKSMTKTILHLSIRESPYIHESFKMWRPMEFIEYLEGFFLRQSYPDIIIYNTIRRYERFLISLYLQKDQIYRRLYLIVKYNDFRSKALIDDIVSADSGRLRRLIHSNQCCTLLQLAVEKRDTHMTRYLLDLWGTMIRSDQLILSLLDSNPLPFHSQPKFWEMMNMLIAKTQMVVPKFPNTRVNPSTADLVSPAYVLITGTDDPSILNDARSKLMVSNEPIRQLSADVRSFRRRAVLSSIPKDVFYYSPSHVKMLAIIMKYRGLDKTLSPREQHYYEKVLSGVLKHILPQVTLKYDMYFAKSLIETVGTRADYDFVNKLMNEVIDLLTDKRQSVWRESQHELRQCWKENPTRKFTDFTYSLENGVRMERSQWLLNVASDESESHVPQPMPLIARVEPVASSLRETSPNNHISKEEYDQIVKIIEEHGRKVLAIDTEEFMKKVDEWEWNHMDKYNELLELGRKLVKNRGAKLVGDYDHLVEDHLHPLNQEIDYEHTNNAAESTIQFSSHAKIDSEPFSPHESAPLSKLSEPTSQQHTLKDKHPLLSQLLFGEGHQTHVEPNIFEHPPHLPVELLSPYQFEWSPTLFERKVISPVPEVVHVPEIIQPPSEMLKLPSISEILHIATPEMPFRFRGR